MLALQALSLSANEQTRSISLESQEEAQLARATRDSMAPSTSSGAAQSLSWSLFTNNWRVSVLHLCVMGGLAA